MLPWNKLSLKWVQVVQSCLKISSSGVAQLESQSFWAPPLQWERDGYLMELLANAGLYSPVILLRLNRCRLYAQVLACPILLMAQERLSGMTI